MFAVVKHGTVLISGADVNPANLERVKPARQHCRESVAAVPAPRPTPCTPAEGPGKEKHTGKELQTFQGSQWPMMGLKELELGSKHS